MAQMLIKITPKAIDKPEWLWKLRPTQFSTSHVFKSHFHITGTNIPQNNKVIWWIWFVFICGKSTARLPAWNERCDLRFALNSIFIWSDRGSSIPVLNYRFACINGAQIRQRSHTDQLNCPWAYINQLLSDYRIISVRLNYFFSFMNVCVCVWNVEST